MILVLFKEPLKEQMATQIERVNMNFFGNLMRAIYEKHTSEITFWRQLRQQSLRKYWKIASK